MGYFETELVAKLHEQTFQFLIVEEANHTLSITLNRPEKKNALHPHMVNELAFALEYANQAKDVWAVVLKANGDIFCAGADLKAFQGGSEEIVSTIPFPNDKVLINEFFNNLTKPCIAQVDKNVLAGGMLIMTGCNYVVAKPSVEFGLPEVKRGLYPFQVMSSLLEVMPARKVIDWCITGKSISAEEALTNGLITHVTENTDEKVNEILSTLFENSPNAIRLGLTAYKKLKEKDVKAENEYLFGMLMQAIGSKDAQEGIAAFREKRQPEWKGE